MIEPTLLKQLILLFRELPIEVFDGYSTPVLEACYFQSAYVADVSLGIARVETHSTHPISNSSSIRGAHSTGYIHTYEGWAGPPTYLYMLNFMYA